MRAYPVLTTGLLAFGGVVTIVSLWRFVRDKFQRTSVTLELEELLYELRECREERQRVLSLSEETAFEEFVLALVEGVNTEDNALSDFSDIPWEEADRIVTASNEHQV